jgi:hypothetical protein
VAATAAAAPAARSVTIEPCVQLQYAGKLVLIAGVFTCNAWALLRAAVDSTEAPCTHLLIAGVGVFAGIKVHDLCIV